MGDEQVQAFWNLRPAKLSFSLRVAKRPVTVLRRPRRTPELLAHDLAALVLEHEVRVGQQRSGHGPRLFKADLVVARHDHLVGVLLRSEPVVEVQNLLLGAASGEVTSMNQDVSQRRSRETPVVAVRVRKADDFHVSSPSPARWSECGGRAHISIVQEKSRALFKKRKHEYEVKCA